MYIYKVKRKNKSNIEGKFYWEIRQIGNILFCVCGKTTIHNFRWLINGENFTCHICLVFTVYIIHLCCIMYKYIYISILCYLNFKDEFLSYILLFFVYTSKFWFIVLKTCCCVCVCLLGLKLMNWITL